MDTYRLLRDGEVYGEVVRTGLDAVVTVYGPADDPEGQTWNTTWADVEDKVAAIPGAELVEATS